MTEMRHIYIHVPFCHRRCIYCDFSIAVRREVPAERYVRAVLTEHDCRRSSGSWECDELKTLYLGGGTPSLLPPNSVCALVDHFLGSCHSSDGLEVTIEANPEDVTTDAANSWASSGINRISLGAQSFDDGVLSWMHRSHSAKDIDSAVSVARAAGIQAVSIDLIGALPSRFEARLDEDLRRALSLQPDHISVYGLTVEPRTALARRILRGVEIPASDSSYEQDFLLADEILASEGFEHYEVSNFAKDGKRAVHNSAYWDGSPYGGLGPSAHEFDGEKRSWNVRPWAEYERRISESGEARAASETLSRCDAALERTYLSLRTTSGLPDEEMTAFDASVVARIEEEGWARSIDGRWRLTLTGWLRLEEIVAVLTTSAEGG